MLFNTRAAQYFLTIAEYQNITVAAKVLCISQPSLSKFLKQLEDETGVPLFRRGNHGLTLTENGQIYYSYVQKALALEDFYTKALQKKKAEKEEKITIGAGSITSYYLTTRVFPRFRKEFPHVRLLLKENIHFKLLRQIRRGDLDLALLVRSGRDTTAKNTQDRLILKQQRVIAISKSNPLSMRMNPSPDNSYLHPQKINPRLLDGSNLIVGVPGQKIYEDMKQMAKQYKIHFQNIIYSQNPQSCIAMASENIGIFIFPPFYFIENQIDTLYFFTFEDPSMQWSLVVQYNPDRYSTAQQRLIELIQSVFKMPESKF